jgi:hypothetical protein
MSILSRSACRWISFICLSLVIVSTAWADEYRTWTDSTGKHKLHAKLESVEDGKAILLQDNGEKMTIPVKKLSKADQDFIAKQNSDAPFQKAEDSTDEPEEKTSEPSVKGPKTVKVDWTQSQAIPPPAPDTEWKVEPSAAPAAEYRPKSVSLPPKKDFFEGLTGMAVSRVAKAAVVGYALEKDNTKTVRLILCNLETGRIAAQASTKGENMAPLALDDDGRRILMCRNEFGFGSQNRLEIWTLKGKNIQRSLVWTPHEGDWAPAQDVIWAEFLDAKKLATCSRGGKIAIWNFASAEPICHLQAAESNIPALSPDRKWIVFATDNSVALLDVEKQEVIASLQTPRKLQYPVLAFSPSGKKIGCVSQDRIFVWDTAAGKLEKDFSLPGIGVQGGVDFPDENFILTSNQLLIELPNQLKLWQYSGAERIRTVGGTTFFAASGNDQSGVLLAAKVPQPAATALLKKALQQPDLFVFHKGTPVRLDVSGIPDPTEQTKATESLTKKLKALNCPIGPTGNVDIVAMVEGPKAREISYMNSGTYQVQEYFTRLKIVYQGQVVWETHYTNIPGFLQLKQGENVEGVLRKASEKPAYELYESVVLPEFVQKPLDNQNPGAPQTLGASQVTSQGLR